MSSVVDIFDSITVHKAPLKSGHAGEATLDLLADPVKRWVVARFVNESRYGWPLRWMPGKIMRIGAPFGPLGSDDTAPVAFFSESDAREQAATCPFKIAKDVAAPIELFTWRVLVTSHYDSSAAELYRGTDHDEAVRALGLALLAVARRDGIYLKAALEGVVDLVEVLKRSGVCPCESELDDPGPTQLATCPYSDPLHDPEKL